MTGAQCTMEKIRRHSAQIKDDEEKRNGPRDEFIIGPSRTVMNVRVRLDKNDDALMKMKNDGYNIEGESDDDWNRSMMAVGTVPTFAKFKEIKKMNQLSSAFDGH